MSVLPSRKYKPITDFTFAHFTRRRQERSSTDTGFLCPVAGTAPLLPTRCGNESERRANDPVHPRVHLGFTLRTTQVTRNAEFGPDGMMNLHAGKTLNWAGATPLWTAFSRPNQSGVAPARHAGSVTRVLPACRSRRMQHVRHGARLNQRG